MLNDSRRRAAALVLPLLLLAAAALTFAAHPRQTQFSGGRGATDDARRWRVYDDKSYGFTIKYPRQFVILPEKGGQGTDAAGRLHRVRFQDRKVASWQTADLEPPQFTIEVFQADGASSLREWLERAQWVAAGDTVEPFEVGGARDGVRVRLMQQLAPNEFYYVATEKYVFRLTPLGPLGPDMLASFRLKAAPKT
jgi:hypothetical protein